MNDLKEEESTAEPKLEIKEEIVDIMEFDEEESNISSTNSPTDQQDEVFASKRLKSLKHYNIAYKSFAEWQSKQGETGFSEDVLLAYMTDASKTKVPSTLFTEHVRLKSMLKMKHNVDIKDYKRLQEFLRGNAKSYIPKTCKYLTAQEVKTFLDQAPNQIYLLVKIVAIFCIYGNCSSNELTAYTTNDVEKKGDELIVHCPCQDKSFVIDSQEYVKLIEEYQALRCSSTNRFFVRYANGRCFMMPVGKNKLSQMAWDIAYFLNLPNPDSYSTRSFRRFTPSQIQNPDKSGSLVPTKTSNISMKPKKELPAAKVQRKKKLKATFLVPEAKSMILIPLAMAPSRTNNDKNRTIAPKVTIPGTFSNSLFSNCTFNIVNFVGQK